MNNLIIPIDFNNCLSSFRPDPIGGSFQFSSMESGESGVLSTQTVTPNHFGDFESAFGQLQRMAGPVFEAEKGAGYFSPIAEEWGSCENPMGDFPSPFVTPPQGQWFVDQPHPDSLTFILNSEERIVSIGKSQTSRGRSPGYWVDFHYLNRHKTSWCTKYEYLVSFDEQGIRYTTYCLPLEPGQILSLRKFLGLAQAPLYEVCVEIVRRLIREQQYALQDLDGIFWCLNDAYPGEKKTNPLNLDGRSFDLPPHAKPQEGQNYFAVESGSGVALDNFPETRALNVNCCWSAHQGSLQDEGIYIWVCSPKNDSGPLPLCPTMQGIWDFFR